MWCGIRFFLILVMKMVLYLRFFVVCIVMSEIELDLLLRLLVLDISVILVRKLVIVFLGLLWVKLCVIVMNLLRFLILVLFCGFWFVCSVFR